MERERRQRLGSTRGRRSRGCRVVAALILVMALIRSASSFGKPSSGHQARDVVARTAHGGRLIRGPGAKLTLRVYDYVPVDPVMLGRAEKVTNAIFEESGIGITWMDCTPLRGDSPPPHPVCPSNMGASDFVVRFFPRRMAVKLATPNEPLGFAQQCPETESGCQLTIFYFRVEETAADGHRAELVLGHVIAHEVAHVLIGPGHSEDGIMRREWSREELRRMSLGLQVGFTSGQSIQLQDAVLRRDIWQSTRGM